VQDGDTIAIGGTISDSVTDAVNGIPVSGPHSVAGRAVRHQIENSRPHRDESFL